MEIGIIGSGTWGIALANHLAQKENNIKLWSFSEQEKEIINNDRSCKFLPGVFIDKKIKAYTDFKSVIDESELILHVTPSKFVRETVKKYKQYITDQPIIMCSKGFEENTLYTLGQVLKEEIPNVKYGMFSGPSHAEEVSVGIPTAMVIASEDENLSNMVQELFMNEKMRVYTSRDVLGVELGGSLKNIIAFCAGACTELGLGDNTLAALISRGLVEISKLGIAMGAEHDTFYGLSGLGDLIVTCMSDHSRNRRAGKLIGKGYTVEQAKKEIGMVIESIDNIKVAYELAKKYNVEMPIVNIVYDVLYNNLNPKEAIKVLMTRGRKSE